jgi:hypothetical protein
MKWTKDKALDAIYRNCEIIVYGNILYILAGTAGNRTLGAISYLQNVEKYPVEVISVDKFEAVKKQRKINY